jgi:hypothetical protein
VVVADGGVLLACHPDGGVAQLGERLLCKQEVIGSIPFTSTVQKTSRFRKSISNRMNAGDRIAVCSR